MLTASTLFKEALKHSHRALTRVTLMAPGSPSGFDDVATLAVTSGSIRLDATRNVRRSGTFKVAPQDSTDLATVKAIDSTYRLRIERGIQYADGTSEWVQIGFMQVQDAKIGIEQGSVDITASDLGSLIDDYYLITPYAPTDLTVINAIKELVELAIVWDTIPGWDIDPTLDAAVHPADGTVFNGSRWDAIKGLAASIGATVSVGVDGRWRIWSAAVDTTTPDAVYQSGPGGVLIDYTRTRSRDAQYNAVTVNWESADTGGLVFIVDADPTSPTFWNGPFGKRPRPAETIASITSEAQAITAATALLDQYRGRAIGLDFTTVHDPLLEPGDVVQVTSRDLSQVHVVDSITYPLAGGRMTVNTRMLQEVA